MMKRMMNIPITIPTIAAMERPGFSPKMADGKIGIQIVVNKYIWQDIIIKRLIKNVKFNIRSWREYHLRNRRNLHIHCKL